MNTDNRIKARLIEDYWLRKLNGVNKVKASDYTFAVADHIPHDITQPVRLIAAGNELAEFILCLSIYGILIRKYLNEPEFIIETSFRATGIEKAHLFIRFSIREEMPLRDLLQQVKEEVLESLRHREYEKSELLTLLEQQPRSESTVSVFYFNYNADTSDNGMLSAGLAAWFSSIHDGCHIKLYVDSKNRDFYSGEDFTLSYKLISQQFNQLLEQPIGTLNVLQQATVDKLMHYGAGREVPLPDATVVDLFQRQVQAYGSHISLVQGADTTTYTALDALVKKLLHHLQVSQDLVKGQSTVAIVANRSIETIAAIWAVLAGGYAYLPIDPAYPPERIQYMLQDSEVTTVLTQSDYLHLFEDFNGYLFALDIQLSFLPQTDTPIAYETSLHSPAYIIYTSGSTGSPKGCVISHQNLASYIQWANDGYFGKEGANFGLFTSLAFDLSVTSLFAPLVSGKSLYLYDGPVDQMLRQLINEPGVQAIKLTPSHINLLEDISGGSASVNTIIVGGEPLTNKQIAILEGLFKNAVVYNEYGPTETTVGCIVKKVTSQDERIFIGQPIDNTNVYVLDEHQQLAPPGAIGELYIGGTGVAQGYFNKADQTSKVFIRDPFKMGNRLYRTGDLARWSTGEDLEFLGRGDHQIKINGYRIEPGEIEDKLLQLPFVNKALVCAKNLHKTLVLVAYLSGQSMAEEEVRRHLEKTLPGYMIPAYFIWLSQFPLTTNGKLDTNQLPLPELAGTQHRSLTQPRNELEELMLTVWKTVLGIEQAGITDNFFKLGGDSIKAIQISSRLFKSGYQMDIGHLFEYPEIALLSEHVKKNNALANQAPVTGRAQLSPIQKTFLSWTAIDQHHYNQGLMLRFDQPVSENKLQAIFRQLQQHHDSLRIRFVKVDGNVYQEFMPADMELSWATINLTDYTTTKAQEQLQIHCNRIQSSLHLYEGPLFKLVLFRMHDADRLLIVCHHAIIDAVSWRILLEDLQSLIQNISSPTPQELPYKTDSYMNWIEALSQCPSQPLLRKEIPYWQQVSQIPVMKIPRDMDGPNRIKDRAVISVQLNEEDTRMLLTSANEAFNTTITDILITALAKAVQTCFNLDEVLLAMEGHGRENIFNEHIHVTRTVGWFTSIYPVIVNLKRGSELLDQLVLVKEQLQKIPSGGVGYSILKAYGEEPLPQSIDCNPEISFNYLGDLGNAWSHNEISIDQMHIGETESPERDRCYLIDMVGFINKSILNFKAIFSARQFRLLTIQTLQDVFKEYLQQIIHLCAQKPVSEKTPSDFTYKQLSLSDLDSIFD